MDGDKDAGIKEIVEIISDFQMARMLAKSLKAGDLCV
jgi:hypothetical protein